MDGHVESLRRFRDRVLLQFGAGRAFVAAYYEHSPPIADWIAGSQVLRAVVRGLLWPLVVTIEHPGGVLTLLVLLLAGVNLRRWRRRTL
jgi:hypothetical protein